ncbi:Protein trichome birefringence-like 10 [Linum grandiflorum]
MIEARKSRESRPNGESTSHLDGSANFSFFFSDSPQHCDNCGRNQWESMLCMLASTVANNDSIYEVNGNPITKHQWALVFKFKDYNCTVESYICACPEYRTLVQSGKNVKRYDLADS